MPTIKINGFVHVDAATLTHSQPRFAFFSFDATNSGYVPIGAHVIEFDPPVDWNPVAAGVAAINAQIDKEGDEHQARVRQLREQLSKLLAIEHSTEEV